MEAWKLHGFIHSGSGVETGGEEEQWERKERGKHETQTGRKENLLTKTPSCTPIQLLLTSSHGSVCIVTRCLSGQVSAPVISAGDCGFTILMSIPATATACQHVTEAGHRGICTAVILSLGTGLSPTRGQVGTSEPNIQAPQAGKQAPHYTSTVPSPRCKSVPASGQEPSKDKQVIHLAGPALGLEHLCPWWPASCWRPNCENKAMQSDWVYAIQSYSQRQLGQTSPFQCVLGFQCVSSVY